MAKEFRLLTKWGMTFRVSSLGEVEREGCRNTWVMLMGSANAKGYLQLDLSTAEGRKKPYKARLIAEAWLDDWDESLQVDHIDGDRVNNAPDNLRMATGSENCRGYRADRGKTSEYRGVSKVGTNWRVYVYIDKVRTHVGYYPTEELAALAFNEAATKAGYTEEALNIVEEYHV